MSGGPSIQFSEIVKNIKVSIITSSSYVHTIYQGIVQSTINYCNGKDYTVM